MSMAIFPVGMQAIPGMAGITVLPGMMPNVPAGGVLIASIGESLPLASEEAGGPLRLFFGCVPHHIPPEKVQEQFSTHGQVLDFYFMPDKMGTDRGWGFVTMGSEEEAQLVIDEMNGKEIFLGGVRPLQVKKSATKMTNLEQSVFEASKKPVTPWQEFFTADSHPYYYNLMTGETVWEKPPELDASVQAAAAAGSMPLFNVGMQGSYGPPGSNLFVFNVPNHWTDVDLEDHFKPYGRVVSAKIHVDPDSGKSKGFGFCSFETPSTAALAIQGMNGFEVAAGRYLKVQVKRGEEAFAVTHQTHAASAAQRAMLAIANR